MENNLYVKDFSIIKKDQFSYIYFVFQITKNEIVYAERKEIIFYDIVNKVEKKVIKCADLGFEQIEQETTFEMILVNYYALLQNQEKNINIVLI